MTRTRFLTGSLATLAIASAFTLATPSAQAAEIGDRPCGQAEIAAVYETVTTPAVFRTVPAVSHSEWTWERDVATYELAFSKVVTPASVETDWARTVAGPVESLYSRIVVDSPAVPAVPGLPATGHFENVVTVPAVLVTETEYVQQQTGKLRWEDVDWGAANGQGNGWSKTGQTREVVVTPAVTTPTWIVDFPGTPGTPAIPASTHTETLWSATDPGAPWTGPTDTRPGATSPESATTDGSAPAGDGWLLVATRTIAAEIDTLWALVAPDGYTPTGESRVSGSSHEETTDSSATAPEGNGWTKAAGSEVEVLDSAETLELVSPESTEEVLVTPAVAATEDCVLAPVDPAEEEVTEEEVTEEAAAPGDAAQGAGAEVATVLPNTGNDIPPWMAPTGLAVMLAGAGLIRFSRRATGL